MRNDKCDQYSHQLWDELRSLTEKDEEFIPWGESIVDVLHKHGMIEPFPIATCIHCDYFLKSSEIVGSTFAIVKLDGSTHPIPIKFCPACGRRF